MFDDKTWERYGALGGVWFVVLAVVGSFLPGQFPARSDTPAEIAKWYTDNDTNIQIGMFLIAIGVIGLVWWFGTLWRMMANAEEATPRVAIIAFAGFVISGAGAMIGTTVNAGTAAGIDVMGEGSAAFFEIVSTSFAFSAVGDAIMAAAVGGLILRTGFLPKWVGQLSYLVVVTALVAAVGMASDADFFGVWGFIAFLVWAVWVLVISVLNYQKLSASA